MGKKRKPLRSNQEIHDKPDFAADWFVGEPKKKEKPKPRDESAVSVGDHLSDGLMKRLEAMKAAMEAEAAPAPAAKGTAKSMGGNKKPRAVRVEDDGEKSFAELFDPEEESEDSFEELLGDSKLDWRSFKE